MKCYKVAAQQYFLLRDKSSAETLESPEETADSLGRGAQTCKYYYKVLVGIQWEWR